MTFEEALDMLRAEGHEPTAAVIVCNTGRVRLWYQEILDCTDGAAWTVDRLNVGVSMAGKLGTEGNA